jgi:ABC-type sugar transport system permease subunit
MYMYNLAVKGSRYEYSAAIAVTLGVATIALVLIAQIVVARRARRAL